MTRRSLNELLAQTATDLPNNSVGAITPADVRNLITDFLDTLVPSYGGLQISQRTQVLSTTPAPLVFMTSVTSFPPEFTLNTATGEIIRTLVSVPRAVQRFTINGDLHGPSGSDMEIRLYANGVPLAWAQALTGRGTNNRNTFAFGAIDATTDVNTIYTLQVKSIVGTPSFVFENVSFIAENVPIRDFNNAVDPPVRFLQEFFP